MAVLAEALSVIVRKDAVARRLRGGEAGFLALVPNRTLCVDERLFRIGFLSPEETARFTDALQAAGLVFLDEDGAAVDLAVADQQHGPTTACRWLGFGRADFDGRDHWVSLCWFREADGTPADAQAALARHTLAVPAGWRFEHSLSHQFAYTPKT